MKFKKSLEVLFLVVGILAVLEFICIRGMFTWFIAVAAVIIIGTLNIIVSLKYKEWLQACLYMLSIIALCMGYYVIGF